MKARHDDDLLEKSVIEEGLRVIEGAEKWYKARLSAVTERVRFGVDPSTNSAATTEAKSYQNLNFFMDNLSPRVSGLKLRWHVKCSCKVNKVII